LNFQRTVGFSFSNISESNNHQFWFSGKIRIKEPPAAVISKTIKNL
jgi:hypothetical protein